MCEFCEEQKIIEFFDGKITWHIREKGKGYDTYYANSKTGELGIIDISYCPRWKYPIAVVSPVGGIYCRRYYYGDGVRPVLYLKSNIFVSLGGKFDEK